MAILAACETSAPADAITSDAPGGVDVPSGIDAPRDAPPLPPEDGGMISGATVELEAPTPEQLAVHVTFAGALPDGVRLEYRPASETTWREGHPLIRIEPDWIASGAPEAPVDAFAGAVFDLSPGTEYDLRLTTIRAGAMDASTIVRAATRALPPTSGPATANVSSAGALADAIAALTPGDVLELADGTYDVAGLFVAVSGTAAQPIVIRGASRPGVVIRDRDGIVLQLQDASHLIVENLTLEGSMTDSGTDASSVGVSFWNGAIQRDVTLRGLDVRGVDQGIVASGETSGLLVYDCVLNGNNTWTAALIETNATWNDDGVRVPGEGNAVFENTVEGFGDMFAVTDGVHSSAVYFYRNRVRMSGDDAFEADYGTRNLAFYDNYITNTATFVSCDPLWGGPLYVFRNVSINTMRGPLKLNNTNAGFMFYSNTILRTPGTTEWGWVQFNNGELRNWAFRNNVLVLREDMGNLLAVESGANEPIDFTHNAFFPDGDIWWSSSGGSWGSLAEASAAVPETTPMFGSSRRRHDRDLILAADPFAAIVLGPDHLTRVDTTTMPAPSGQLLGAGVPIPGVTDGFTGSAPDIGAIITGRPVPTYGARR